MPRPKIAAVPKTAAQPTLDELAPAERIARLQAQRDRATDELAAQRRRAAAAWDAALAGPEMGLDGVDVAQNRIARLEQYLAEVDRRLDAARGEHDAQRKRDALAASAADRTKAVTLAQQAIGLAGQVDAAAEALINAIRTLRAHGAATDAFVRRALSAAHRDETHRLHDLTALLSPRAQCTSGGAASAMVSIIQRVVDAAGNPTLSRLVDIEPLARGGTLAAAVESDAVMIRDRFAEPKGKA